MINRSRMAALTALVLGGASVQQGGHILGMARSEEPRRIVGPKYKPEKPKKNRALRRIKGR